MSTLRTLNIGINVDTSIMHKIYMHSNSQGDTIANIKLINDGCAEVQDAHKNNNKNVESMMQLFLYSNNMCNICTQISTMFKAGFFAFKMILKKIT